MKLIRCKDCGAQNQLENHSLRRRAYCGNCHVELPEPLLVRSVQIILRYKFWLILISIIVGALVLNEYNSTAKLVYSGQKSAQAEKSALAKQPIVYPVVPISQGIHKIYNKSERIAPLRIMTPVGSENYFVKLVSLTSGKICNDFLHQRRAKI